MTGHHKPTEFYEVKRWFSGLSVASRWGNLTDGFNTRDDAWVAFVDGFAGIEDPTTRNAMVVKIDLADGTSRDVTEDWCATWQEEHGEPEDLSSHDYHDRFGPS